MGLNDMKVGDVLSIVKALQGGVSNSDGLNHMLGQHVIVRTYSAGNWFGVLSEKSGAEVILTEARRMHRWWAAESISLSAVAIYGIKADKSKIVEPVGSVWLEAIEIIPCTDVATKSISGAPYVKAE